MSLLCVLCASSVNSVSNVSTHVRSPASRPNPHPRRFPRTCRDRKTNPARAFSFQDMRVNLRPKMFQHRLNRRRHNLPQSAYRSQAHRLATSSSINARSARYCVSLTPPCVQRASISSHLLRAHPARHALSARFIPVKSYRIQRHIQHAGCIVANHNRTRSQHRARIRQRLEIQSHIHHRSRQVSRRRPRWRERLQLLARRESRPHGR